MFTLVDSDSDTNADTDNLMVFEPHFLPLWVIDVNSLDWVINVTLPTACYAS